MSKPVKAKRAAGGGKQRPQQRTDTVETSKRPVENGREPNDNSGKRLPPALYVVATPIGNAADITVRALDVLRAVTVIACEDTRTTAKLLAIHGIANALVAYHEHNAKTAGPRLLARIRAGEAVALVSEAGTPLISDPGYRLVERCIAEDVTVVPVPGPSAVLAALAVAGLPTDRFHFAGFAPPRGASRRRFLDRLAGIDATLVILESPRRLAESLGEMVAAFGPREAAVCRELTKLFEEVRRGPLSDLARQYETAGPPKGEVTIVVAPPNEAEAMSDAEVDRRLAEALKEGTAVRAAAERVARGSGRPRRDLYARALALRAAASGTGDG